MEKSPLSGSGRGIPGCRIALGRCRGFWASNLWPSGSPRRWFRPECIGPFNG